MRLQNFGPIVPSRIEFRMKAKALGMVNVDEKIVLTYTNYESIDKTY